MHIVYTFSYCCCATRAEEETVRAAFQPAAPVDFDSLRSLADEGIDMSFMDSLQKQYNASRLQVQY
jgi:PBP1b-binding outer membrane lipoprotein LpoB